MGLQRKFLVSTLLAGWLAWGLRAQEPAAPDRAVAVVIALKPKTQVTSGLVRLGDVADLTGGTANLRARAAALDLAELHPSRSEVVVSQEQVYFRMRLAGWEPRQFQLTGAVTTLAGRGSKMLEPAADKATPTQPAGLAAPIKTRDAVRLLARIGNVQVTARGEALQDGQAGQIIRVRNIVSNRIVTGRLVESNIVEVDY